MKKMKIYLQEITFDFECLKCLIIQQIVLGLVILIYGYPKKEKELIISKEHEEIASSDSLSEWTMFEMKQEPNRICWIPGEIFICCSQFDSCSWFWWKVWMKSDMNCEKKNNESESWTWDVTLIEIIWDWYGLCFFLWLAWKFWR